MIRNLGQGTSTYSVVLCTHAVHTCLTEPNRAITGPSNGCRSAYYGGMYRNGQQGDFEVGEHLWRQGAPHSRVATGNTKLVGNGIIGTTWNGYLHHTRATRCEQKQENQRRKPTWTLLCYQLIITYLIFY